MRLFLLGALPLIVGVVTPAPAARADFTPGISPPGANDWSCRPTALHPYPVVLVHGTFGDMTVSWNLISPVLKPMAIACSRSTTETARRDASKTPPPS